MPGQHEIGTHQHQRPESKAGGNQTQKRTARNEGRTGINNDNPQDAYGKQPKPAFHQEVDSDTGHYNHTDQTGNQGQVGLFRVFSQTLGPARKGCGQSDKIESALEVMVLVERVHADMRQKGAY